MIVPIFVAHEGCPYRCSFCNQSNITGTNKKSDKSILKKTLRTHFEGLDLKDLPEHRELAFFGGSFTGIPSERQEYLLSAVQPWIVSGEFQSIRISTHALLVDEAKLSLLSKYHVKTVELGIQSTDNEVLLLAGRECPYNRVQSAANTVRAMGFRLGLQLMPGLPGDNEEKFRKSVADVISLKPDFVRIYPTLVIKNTELFNMYQQGTFIPWNLERMIEAVKEAVQQFENADLPIIRIGLHPDPSLLENYVAGPFHPSFRYLVDCRVAQGRMIKMVRNLRSIPSSVIFRVPSRKLSVYIGHQKENLSVVKNVLGLDSLIIQPGSLTGNLELVA